MNTLLILGGGTAGTMVANRMSHNLDPNTWNIVVVDRDDQHQYQPGYSFIPFNIYNTTDVIKPRHEQLPAHVKFIQAEVARIEPAANQVILADNQALQYKELVIASGAHPAPELTPGLAEAWHKTAFDFYTLEGAVQLNRQLQTWKGGHMVIAVLDTLVKAPTAPIEFAFMADWAFHRWNLRDKCEITLITPHSEPLPQQHKASAALQTLFSEKDIRLVTGFDTARVEDKRIYAADGRGVAFDMLVVVARMRGAAFVGASELGDDRNYFPVDKFTLQGKLWENIWAIGDAADTPAPKTASAAHSMLPTLTENLLSHIRHEPLKAHYDGHAYTFIDTGDAKAFLVDFDYDFESGPGRVPVPVVGPFARNEESSANHQGKMGYRWFYWNVLLKGRDSLQV